MTTSNDRDQNDCTDTSLSILDREMYEELLVVTDSRASSSDLDLSNVSSAQEVQQNFDQENTRLIVDTLMEVYRCMWVNDEGNLLSTARDFLEGMTNVSSSRISEDALAADARLENYLNELSNYHKKFGIPYTEAWIMMNILISTAKKSLSEALKAKNLDILYTNDDLRVAVSEVVSEIFKEHDISDVMRLTKKASEAVDDVCQYNMWGYEYDLVSSIDANDKLPKLKSVIAFSDALIDLGPATASQILFFNAAALSFVSRAIQIKQSQI